jgi:hypothetical protein
MTAHPDQAECWRVDAGAAEVAELRVPPHARRDRRFEVSVSMTVRTTPVRGAAWHRLTVTADGARQWQRRIDSHLPEQGWASDGLDYRFERLVQAGESLRIVAEAASVGVQRRSLVIEAEEIRD